MSARELHHRAVRARSSPWRDSIGDELIVARCDLDSTKSYKETIFNFALHRVPEAYRLIVERKGAGPPMERPPVE